MAYNIEVFVSSSFRINANNCNFRNDDICNSNDPIIYLLKQSIQMKHDNLVITLNITISLTKTMRRNVTQNPLHDNLRNGLVILMLRK